jgi:hypothetical protein
MARRTPPSQLIGSGLIPQQFLNEDIGIEDTYQSTLANLGKNERSLFQEYGVTGGIGEGGAVNFQIDPTNSRGQYQQLLQSIGNQLGQAKTEVRGRGLGRAGLAKAREGLIRYMMSGEKSGLLNQFQKGAGDIFGQRGQALTTKNRARTALEGSALDWWNQYGPDDPDGNVAEPAPSEAPAPSIPQLPQLGVGYGSNSFYQPVPAGQQPWQQEAPAMAPTPQAPSLPQLGVDYSNYSFYQPYKPPPKKKPASSGGGGGVMYAM